MANLGLARFTHLSHPSSPPLPTPMSFRGGRPKVRRGMNPSPGRGRSPCRRSAEAEAESKGRAGAGLSPPPTPMSFRGSARNLGLARSHPSSPSHSLDVPQMLQVRLWRAPRRESRDENSGLDNITGMLNLARFLELCNRVSKAEGRGVRACLPPSGHADYSTPHPTPFLLIYAHHPASMGGNHGPAYRHAHRRPGR